MKPLGRDARLFNSVLYILIPFDLSNPIHFSLCFDRSFAPFFSLEFPEPFMRRPANNITDSKLRLFLMFG